MRRAIPLLTAFVLALAGCASVPSTADGQTANEYVYVTAQDDALIRIVDISTLEIAETVDLQELGFGPNAKPHHIAVEKDGSAWYVSLIGENRILKFDADNELVGEATFEVPGMIALHPTEDVLYVGRSMSAVNPPQRVGIVNRTTMEVDEVGVFFPRPHAIAIRPEGDVAYTASLAQNQIAAVDAEGEEVELVDVAGETHAIVQVAISPDGRTMVGTGELTGELMVWDLTDPWAPALQRRVQVGSRPWHPVYSHDGSRVYFGNKGDNSVTIVNTGDWSTETVAHAGFMNPHGSAISPDGRYLFVSNNGAAAMDMGGMDHEEGMDHAEGEEHGDPLDGLGRLVVIDTATRDVVKVIPVGGNSTGVGTAGSRAR